MEETDVQRESEEREALAQKKGRGWAREVGSGHERRSGRPGTHRRGGQPRGLLQAAQRRVPCLGRHTERLASGLIWRLWDGVQGGEGWGFRAELLFPCGGQERLLSRAQRKTRVMGYRVGGSPI